MTGLFKKLLRSIHNYITGCEIKGLQDVAIPAVAINVVESRYPVDIA